MIFGGNTLGAAPFGAGDVDSGTVLAVPTSALILIPPAPSPVAGLRLDVPAVSAVFATHPPALSSDLILRAPSLILPSAWLIPAVSAGAAFNLPALPVIVRIPAPDIAIELILSVPVMGLRAVLPDPTARAGAEVTAPHTSLTSLIFPPNFALLEMLPEREQVLLHSLLAMMAEAPSSLTRQAEGTSGLVQRISTQSTLH